MLSQEIACLQRYSFILYFMSFLEDLTALGINYMWEGFSRMKQLMSSNF